MLYTSHELCRQATNYTYEPQTCMLYTKHQLCTQRGMLYPSHELCAQTCSLTAFRHQLPPHSDFEPRHKLTSHELCTRTGNPTTGVLQPFVTSSLPTAISSHAYESRTMYTSHELRIRVTNYVYTSRTHESRTMYTNYVYESRTM